jgi:hypothetical protein
MVSHVPGGFHHNPDRSDRGAAAAAHWPVNSANRFDSGPRAPHVATGERHLSALRMVHDAIAERGVAETVRLFDTQQLTRAAAASRYFDLNDLADFINRAGRAAGAREEAAAFDDEYRRRFVAGDAVREAVARKKAQTPSDFPPAPGSFETERDS